MINHWLTSGFDPGNLWTGRPGQVCRSAGLVHISCAGTAAVYTCVNCNGYCNATVSEFMRTRGTFLFQATLQKLHKRRANENKMKQGSAGVIETKGLLATKEEDGLGCRCVIGKIE